jgi:carbon monoxide dehydrogenase subunit G
MSTFTSDATINQPVEKVYQFLADMNNHQQLMPEGVTEWESTSDTASFKVQNIITLKLKFGEKADNNLIKLIPAEKPPFDLSLTWQLEPANGQTNVSYTITAELSMMMKMMASGPLQKLADHEMVALAKTLLV